MDNYLFVNKTTLTLDPNRQGIEELYQALIDTGVIEDTGVDVGEHINTDIYEKALLELIEEYPEDAFFSEKLTLFEEFNG